MKFKFAALVAAAIAVGTPVLAQDLHFPSLSYRTGPFAAGGIPFADGYSDYLTLMNERDGGIGGVRIRQTECETAYNTEKGVECYESIKGDNPLVIQPLSTGITYQLIPKVTADGIPLHTMGYGRTSAKNGTVFSHVFNYPANYWDGASIAIKHLLDINGGKLDGKKITLLYHNSAYGKEPIRTLEELAKKHGYVLNLLPVDSPGQEQKSQWLQIRRDRPDYVIMWGWGVMNAVAVQEAVNIRFPMENFIGVWWSGSENDVLPAGDGAHGYKSLAMHGTGTDYPVYADMKKYVIDAGKAAGNGDQVGSVLYSRGMYAAMLAVEAAKTAQEIHKTAAITPAMMRDGMEALVIDQAKLTALGLPNFSPDFSVSCENHGGNGYGLIQQWDAKAKKWNLITDWIQSDSEVIDALIVADSEAYAKEANLTKRCN
ncbi:MAG: ABC transporter substrate-binding protein [Gemmobacter sp.]|jgi:branched-chain amino acid transport system substrate-binding protein|nr:ABC transporter substrate-binding protein [Gemmobacter sp.]